MGTDQSDKLDSDIPTYCLCCNNIIEFEFDLYQQLLNKNLIFLSWLLMHSLYLPDAATQEDNENLQINAFRFCGSLLGKNFL